MAANTMKPIRHSAPPTSLLSPEFRYTPAAATDIRRRWEMLGLIEIGKDGEREVPAVRLGEKDVSKQRAA